MRLSKIFIPAAIMVVLLAGIFSGCVPPVPEVIEVTGVEITEDDQSIKVDETLQLTAVVIPEDADNKAITWESDNPDVAKVDETGLVTALKTGTANITVTTEDGAFTDTIKIITVTSPSSGGDTAPAPKEYEVTFGVHEENNVVPAGISSRLIRTDDNGSGSEPNLDGVTIEIFSDKERTNSVEVITTGNDGIATVKLTKGEYYFIASKEGYVCGPEEGEGEFITLPTTPVATPAVSGSFIIEDDNVSVTIIALKAYIVTFMATDSTYPVTTGLSRELGIPLDGVNIEIYISGLMGTSIQERTKTALPEYKIATITTDASGIAQVYLLNFLYSYKATKEGYLDYPDPSLLASFIVDSMPINVTFSMCDITAAQQALDNDISWLTGTALGNANFVGSASNLSEEPVVSKTLPSSGPNGSTIDWSDVTTDTGDAAASKVGNTLELSFPNETPDAERISTISATLTNNCGASDIIQFTITTERYYFGSDPDNWSWSISVAEDIE